LPYGTLGPEGSWQNETDLHYGNMALIYSNGIMMFSYNMILTIISLDLWGCIKWFWLIWICFILKGIICKFWFAGVFSLLRENFQFHEFYFENWLCIILNRIICKFSFLSVFEPILEKNFLFHEFYFVNCSC